MNTSDEYTGEGDGDDDIGVDNCSVMTLDMNSDDSSLV